MERSHTTSITLSATASPDTHMGSVQHFRTVHTIGSILVVQIWSTLKLMVANVLLVSSVSSYQRYNFQISRLFLTIWTPIYLEYLCSDNARIQRAFLDWRQRPAFFGTEQGKDTYHLLPGTTQRSTMVRWGIECVLPTPMLGVLPYLTWCRPLFYYLLRWSRPFPSAKIKYSFRIYWRNLLPSQFWRGPITRLDGV